MRGSVRDERLPPAVLGRPVETSAHLWGSVYACPMTSRDTSGQPPVSRLARAILSLFAAPRINIRADYEKVRRVQRALARIIFRGPYRILDQAVLGKDGHEIPVRVFLPKSTVRPGALVFFHGGGWVTGARANGCVTGSGGPICVVPVFCSGSPAGMSSLPATAGACVSVTEAG